jgi:hypothetical protein
MSNYVYILSKMTNSVTYRTYRLVGDAKQKAGPLPVPNGDEITIRGGADRPSQRIGFGEASNDINGNVIWTPRGVVTKITQDQYDRLKEQYLFKLHMDGGYLAVVDLSTSESHKKVARVAEDMEGENKDALLKKETIAQRIKVKTPGVGDGLSQEWV